MKSFILIVFVIIGSLFAFNGSTKENSPSKRAMIDLSPNKPAHKLFPLTILTINGKSVNHRNDMMMLEPGKYHLKFSANINLNLIAGAGRILKTKINQRKYTDSLDLDVESGNIYHLAFDASSARVEDWKPVLLSTTKHK